MNYLLKCLSRLVVFTLIALSLTAPALANADRDCASLIGRILDSKKAPERAYKRKAKNLRRLSAKETLTEKEAQPFIDHISKVQNEILTLTESLVGPENLKVNMLPSDFSPHYNLIEDTLQTTFQLVRQDPFLNQNQLQMHAQMGLPVKLYKKHPKFGYAVTAHEYGHGVLNASLRKDFPQMAEFLDVMKGKIMPIVREYEQLNEQYTEVILKILEIEKQYIEVPALIKDPSTGGYAMNPAYLKAREESEALKELQEIDAVYRNLILETERIQTVMKAKSDEADELMAIVKASGNPFVESFNKISHYHELFADLIAVVSADKYDPSLISKSIYLAREYQKNSKSVKQVASYRDFASKMNKLDKWVPTTQVHGFLGPVRHFLHENYLKKPSYQSGEKLGKLLEGVYQAIKEHVEILNTKPEMLEQMSPAQLNKFLMETIEKKMQ